MWRKATLKVWSHGRFFSAVLDDSRQRNTHLPLPVIPRDRPVPGSQPPFSLNQNPDQNKEDTWFISVVAYDHCIKPFMFNSILPFTSPKFRAKCHRSSHDPGTLGPGTQTVSTDFHGVQIISSKKHPAIKKYYTMDNQAQFSELPQHFIFCQSRRLKIKRTRAWKCLPRDRNTSNWRQWWPIITAW